MLLLFLSHALCNLLCTYSRYYNLTPKVTLTLFACICSVAVSFPGRHAFLIAVVSVHSHLRVSSLARVVTFSCFRPLCICSIPHFSSLVLFFISLLHVSFVARIFILVRARLFSCDNLFLARDSFSLVFINVRPQASFYTCKLMCLPPREFIINFLFFDGSFL